MSASSEVVTLKGSKELLWVFVNPQHLRVRHAEKLLSLTSFIALPSLSQSRLVAVPSVDSASSAARSHVPEEGAPSPNSSGAPPQGLAATSGVQTSGPQPQPQGGLEQAPGECATLEELGELARAQELEDSRPDGGFLLQVRTTGAQVLTQSESEG